MAEVFYGFLCERCSIKEISLETIEEVRKYLENVSPSEIAEKTKLSKHFIGYHRALLLLPTIKQQVVLYKLFELGKKKRTVFKREIFNDYGFSLKFIELLKPPPIKKIKKGLLKINSELLKEYWPEIEYFRQSEHFYFPKRGKKRKMRRRAPYGKRIQQALQLLGKSSLKELDKNDIRKIKNLSRADFLSKGWDITHPSLHQLRKRLIEHTLQNT